MLSPVPVSASVVSALVFASSVVVCSVFVSFVVPESVSVAGVESVPASKQNPQNSTKIIYSSYLDLLLVRTLLFNYQRMM